MPNSHIVRLITAVAIGALAGIALIHTAHAQQKAAITINPEISLGGAFSTSELAIGSFKSDSGQYGFLYGAGVGLGVTTNSLVFEPFARYSFMHDGGKNAFLLGPSVNASNLIDTGIRVGFRATKSTNVYALGGYAWEDLSLGNLKKSPSGFEVGAGIEHSLFASPLFVRAEYVHDFFDSQGVTVVETKSKVTPDLNVVRVGLVYKFGTGASAPNVFDTSGLAPAAEGCDPKMANCHPLK